MQYLFNNCQALIEVTSDVKLSIKNVRWGFSCLCRNVGMAQSGAKLGKLRHDIRRRIRVGPSLALRLSAGKRGNSIEIKIILTLKSVKC